MKILVIGLPRSGRSTVAKTVAETHGYQYIDAMSWVRSAFREIQKDEHPFQYEDEYHRYLSTRRMINPNFITDYVQEMIKVMGQANDAVFIIDGIFSPKDFTNLFDYRQDVVVFLNRIDKEHEFRDHENIGVSVIRDYCFWMSSASLIEKSKWIEYNFKILEEGSDQVKIMGARNSVFIVKNINN